TSASSVESANQESISAAVSSAPVRSRSPGGMSARSSAAGAKQLATPAGSRLSIAATKRLPNDSASDTAPLLVVDRVLDDLAGDRLVADLRLDARARLREVLPQLREP